MLGSISKLMPGSSPLDSGALREGVRSAYSRAAQQPRAKHPFPVGRDFAVSLGYPEEVLADIPGVALEAFVGVSNVSVFAEIPQGSSVLDIGCGAGLDALITAGKTGKSGKVVGLDFSEEMLRRARQAARAADVEGIAEFQCAAAEAIPLPDGAVDIVLVNGIFNLNPYREQVIKEIARVLRDGGVLYGAELVFTEPVDAKQVCRLDDWFA